MKKTYPLLSVFLFTAFFSASPTYPEDTSVIASPFTTASETQDYAKIEEHPISESGDVLESEPERVQFAQSFDSPPPPLPLPVPTAKPKTFATGDACKDECFQQQGICFSSLLDYSQTQPCNNTFMSCLRGCYSKKNSRGHGQYLN